jgi:hypothetical protein
MVTAIMLIAGSLPGCGGGQPALETDPVAEEPPNELDPGRQLNDITAGNEIVGQARWSENTRVWRDADRVLEVVPGESVTLALNDGESLDIGRILVGQGPNGSFTGKVVGITQSERSLSGLSGDVVTVELQPAPIEEIFDEFSISLRDQPVRDTAPQPAAGGSTVLVDNDILRAVASSSFQLDPSPDFDLALDLDFAFIVPTGVNEFKAIFSAGVANRIELDLEVKKPFSNRNEEKLVKEKDFDPIGIEIFGVDLKICPSMKIFVGIDGSAVGTGNIKLGGLASASTRIGVDCPVDGDCDGLFEFPFNADVTLESTLTGAGANLLVYSRAEFTIDVLCTPTLASTTMSLQPTMEINIEPRPSRSASPFANCDGLLTQGTERTKLTVDAGADGKVTVDLTLFEDEFRFDVDTERVLNECEIDRANPPELAPIQDTALFTVLTPQIIEFEEGVDVTEELDENGEVVFRLANNGRDGGRVDCRCPAGSFGVCLGSYPHDGGTATCEFECESAAGDVLPCAFLYTPPRPTFNIGIDIGRPVFAGP